MLEEILIQMLDLQGYCLTKAELREDGLHLWADLKVKEFRCQRCGQQIFSIHSHWEVTLRERPVLGSPTFLHLPHYRVRCRCQRKPLAVEVPVKEPGFRVTRRLALAVIAAAKEVTVKFVAQHYGLNWSTVRDMDMAYLKNRIAEVPGVHPNTIGVDEAAYAEGRKYLTIVTDQSSRRVIFVTEGRRAVNFEKFFKERIDPMACKWLEAACVDMWDPYVTILHRYARQALIVYDRFHLIGILNHGVDLVRRDQQQQLRQEGKTLWKRQRYLLLRGQERLSPQQQQTLQQILDQNKHLQQAYLLKEQFRQLYDLDQAEDEAPQDLYQRAFQFLVGWMNRAVESGLKPFLRFVNQLKRRWAGVLNYFRYPITNGLSEGLNNKIATLKKRAYGFRNLEYFTLKIYQQGGFI